MSEDGPPMGERGVTRPMAHKDLEGRDDGDNGMDRDAMLVDHHRRTVWVWWAIIMLGAWMVASTVTFQHHVGMVDVAGDRWLPFDRATSADLMRWSDLASGALLIVFGILSLNPFRPWARWAAFGVGVWLNAAPLVFWAPTAVAYLNDTLVGMLVVALTILVPGMPWMVRMMKHGPTTPPGWTYNPSSWAQRWILAATGLVGLLVSRYLGAYQMGYTTVAWDPVFGIGTHEALTSDVSHMWPVSDGGLGAFSYTFEFLMAFMGSPQRWRTMPWMVTLFGILVIPLGLTHIALVISQPVLVGHWCTLCLVAAAVMLPMIPLEVDEVVAMGQFLRRARREGQPFWRTFWKGGTVEGGGPDERSPRITAPPRAVAPAMFWGVSFPSGLVTAALLGVWLMIAPAIFGIGIQQPAADSDHLVGALVLVLAVVAMAEVMRALRWLLVPLGMWLIVAPFVLDAATAASTVNDVLAGVLLIVLAVPRGPVRERYGSWDRLIRLGGRRKAETGRSRAPAE